jgi:hypothetical protein
VITTTQKRMLMIKNGSRRGSWALLEAIKAEEQKDQDTKKTYILPLIALYDPIHDIKLKITLYIAPLC